MGFHLVGRVYHDVKGTSSTAQAVLAYLAHTADDNGRVQCHPSVSQIEAATHLGHTAIHNALNELRNAGLLKWKPGGRSKGNGGRALANTYYFNLPNKVGGVSSVRQTDGACVRKTDDACSAKRTMYTPPDGQCILHQADTINNNQPSSQPSISTEVDVSSDFNALLENTANKIRANSTVVLQPSSKHPSTATNMDKESSDELRSQYSKDIEDVVDMAMNASRYEGMDEKKTRECFTKTIFVRNLDKVKDVIYKFDSERKKGEHKNLKNPASCLNSKMAEIPKNEIIPPKEYKAH